MTPQHPAAPETETDANGRVALTEAEWMPVEERLIALWQCETEAGYDEFAGRVQRAVERIVAERVRVVEGERDAAQLALGEQADIEREAFGRGVAWAMGDDEEAPAALTARAESAEAAHEAARELCHEQTTRAESANLAHEAEKAAHERLRAGVAEIASAITLTAKQVREQGDVRQVVLGDDGVDEGPTLADELWAFGFNLTSLLGGGGAR